MLRFLTKMRSHVLSNRQHRFQRFNPTVDPWCALSMNLDPEITRARAIVISKQISKADVLPSLLCVAKASFLFLERIELWTTGAGS
jgi:hypothetical protein